MTTATITLDALEHLANLAAFTAPASTRPPVLSAIQVSVAGGEVRGSATDRYCAATYTGLAAENEELPAVLAPVGILKDAVKGAKASRANQVTITHDEDEGTLTIDYGTGRVSAKAVEGNYPPLSRLYDVEDSDTLPKGYAFNSTYLARLAKLTNATARRPFDRVNPFALSIAPNNALRARGGGYDVLIMPNKCL